MAFFSGLIKRLGFFEKSRRAAVARTRVLRLEPLEDRRLLTAAPDNFTVVRIGETQVGLHWTPRPEPEPDVTGYEVEVSINGSDNWRPFFAHEPIVQSDILDLQAACDANVPPPPQQPPPCYFNKREVYRSYYFRIQSLPAESTPIWSLVDGANARPVNTPEDNTVKVSAIAHSQIDVPLIAATIELRWPEELAYRDADYTISRKEKDELSFTQVASLTWDGQNPITGWTDENLGNKTAYEYQVERHRKHDASSPPNPFFSGPLMEFGNEVPATGYVYAGVDVPLDDPDSTIESPGTVMLVIDISLTGMVPDEMDRLEDDMRAEGWDVLKIYVSPHDDLNPQSAENLNNIEYKRNEIIYAYEDPNVDLKAVLLLGHVPIPMSGWNDPDGHGARPMPADVYYGDMDGVWTDDTDHCLATAVCGPLAPAINEPNEAGDGIFDQKEVPAAPDGNRRVELMVGRVDMHDLPEFYKYDLNLTVAEWETKLLKRYLDKDHAFRTGEITVERKGRIRDFHAGTTSAGAWQTLSGLFGPAENPTQDDPDNIDVNKWKKTGWSGNTPEDSFLWGHGSSDAGDPTRFESYRIVSTETLAAPDGQPDVVPGQDGFDHSTVFNSFLGSWLLQWQKPDSMLRAILADEGYGLTTTWAGLNDSISDRGKTYFQQMSLGETIGAGLLNTQNHQAYDSSGTGVFASLLGDPTLRMFVVQPPGEVTRVVGPLGVTDVRWEDSPDGEVTGYHVYRSTGPGVAFVRLTTAGPTSSPYLDPGGGVNYSYLVRAVKTETTGGGTFVNLSAGVYSQDPYNHPGLVMNQGTTTDEVALNPNFVGFSSPQVTVEVTFASDIITGGHAAGVPIFSYATTQQPVTFRLFVNSEPQNRMRLTINGFTKKMAEGDVVRDLFDGADHHIVVTYDSMTTVAWVYADGVAISTGRTFAVGPVDDDGGTGGIFVLGQDPDNETGPDYGFDPEQILQGTILETRIYDDVRSHRSRSKPAMFALSA